MPRGRPRKHNPTIPAHIDQAALPVGIYFADGRWYRLDPCPEGGRTRKKTVASAAARLSELHDIMEQARGGQLRGTVAYVFDQYLASAKFRQLAAGTQRDYAWADKAVRNFPTKLGVPLGQLKVDQLSTAVFQKLVDQVAETTPAKANHMLRYARLAFAHGVRRAHCGTNPAKGVEQAQERRHFAMPEHDVYNAVLAFARARGDLKAHAKGSLSPYLAPAMELAYGCRLRGIEVNTLTDANALDEGILSNRRKRSRDNVTAWNPALRAAWDELAASRKAAYDRTRRPVPLHPHQRYLLVSESATPLRKSSLDSAWQRLMDAAEAAKVITESQRFTLHGLKHRGITDSTDKAAGGHRTEAMRQRYDHEIPLVEPAQPREFSRQFSRRQEKGT